MTRIDESMRIDKEIIHKELSSAIMEAVTIGNLPQVRNLREVRPEYKRIVN